MRIWAVRMNSGAMFGSHQGKKWAVRFGRKGMADILAIRKRVALSEQDYEFYPTWIEVKAPSKHQSPDQILFQKEVEAEGHRYLLVHSWEELCIALKA